MNFQYVLTSSKPRLVFLSLLAFAAMAIVSFGLGAEASQAAGGVSAGGGSPGGEETTSHDAAPSKYGRIWDDLPSREKHWAQTTSRCESGGDPDAIGGGGAYRGAFQFLKSTWKASPKSPGGDPINFDYRTQAVVAVLLKKRDGVGHWPVCG